LVRAISPMECSEDRRSCERVPRWRRSWRRVARRVHREAGDNRGSDARCMCQ
jgi:hypothetical protein